MDQTIYDLNQDEYLIEQMRSLSVTMPQVYLGCFNENPILVGEALGRPMAPPGIKQAGMNYYQQYANGSPPPSFYPPTF